LKLIPFDSSLFGKYSSKTYFCPKTFGFSGEKSNASSLNAVRGEIGGD